jgi:predicted hydrocarbon binding protein
VSTEHSPEEILDLLAEAGMGRVPAGLLSFVDAFSETVGLSTGTRADTAKANCQDLNSISMAVVGLQRRIRRENTLLAFDSLTSPYLFNKEEAFRFISLFLGRFTSEGNAVLALLDEGCGQDADYNAMMSAADGIIKISVMDEARTLSVMKHPNLKPVKIELPSEPERASMKPSFTFEPGVMRQFLRAYTRGEGMRVEVGDFVNLLWPDLAHWSCMLWDPKGFSTMIYDLNKEESSMVKETLPFYPWTFRLKLGLAGLLGMMPKNLSEPKDVRGFPKMWPPATIERIGILEYLEDESRTDEHHIRIHESSDCWGLESVGTAVASHLPPSLAGTCIGLERRGGLERDWNAVETKCIGLGDPYCEWKLVPGEIDGLRASLEKDAPTVERVYHRLMNRLIAYMLEGEPLVERPRLGSEIHIHAVMHVMGFPHVAGERYRMAQRMGGAKSGRDLGSKLMDSGFGVGEATERLVEFMNHCKVGEVTSGETFRIWENCECLRTKIGATGIREPCCYFTTGFLSGFFSAVRDQHVKETKCTVAGDPYCEWEFA